ncbi:hypothetical protein K7711_36925 [Nocardia sp. CA2R105]|uniref:hypothetical protein n=1 Tax=Nocardia coffeae TaxID=2873381 RepID=UPI001CA6D605|nr:hypothetical protein [Nocardia coffeae]MBY8862107.1 hypothetical protein [Nocardia coffeae]
MLTAMRDVDLTGTPLSGITDLTKAIGNGMVRNFGSWCVAATLRTTVTVRLARERGSIELRAAAPLWSSREISQRGSAHRRRRIVQRGRDCRCYGGFEFLAPGIVPVQDWTRINGR